MVPVAASTAFTGEASTFAKSTMESSATSSEVLTGVEAAEAREAILGDKGLLEQMGTIRHSSWEAVAARNEASVKEIPQIVKNNSDGAARENAVKTELLRDYPAAQGYKVESQLYLRNQDGTIALDPSTQEGRRLDSVVIKDGQVIRSIEVTSEAAPKALQSAKEDRIREAGGNYVQVGEKK
jgi:hypothetical protein